MPQKCANLDEIIINNNCHIKSVTYNLDELLIFITLRLNK